MQAMAKNKASHRFDFTVDVDGTTYKCHRDVTGTRVLRQRIHVDGIGSKSDGVSYGPRLHSASTMESVAKIIAAELIRQGARGE
jgi:hypothetical protein